MIGESKKMYNNYKFKTINDIKFEINQTQANKDRTFMMTMLNPTLEYLKKKGINETQNFIEIMKKYQLTREDVRKFIKNFQILINSNEESNKILIIDWIRDRELKKANFNEKNLILNRLILEYPNEMYYYVQQYANNNLLIKTKCPFFIQEFRQKICLLFNSSSCL